MDNLDSMDPFEPGHSFRGILSFVLPSIVLSGVASQLTALLGTPVGALFLYCISPVILLTGAILSFSELRNKKRSSLFPTVGMLITILALLPMLLVWLLGLMQGAPFSCLENPSFCGW